MAALAEKAAAFDRMNLIYSDDEFDASEQRERQQSRRFFNPKTSTVQPPPPGSAERYDAPPPRPPGEHLVRATPRRVVSAPMPGHTGPVGSGQVIKQTPIATLGRRGRLTALMNNDTADVILVDDTPIPDSNQPLPRVLKRSDSTPVPFPKRLRGFSGEDSASPSMFTKKRKREPVLKLRPEEEQIFKGLSFFYVPDNDIAPARRLRITRAREYGATWTRTPFDATHVVVEKNIEFKDIENILARASKQARPTIVNEDYPIDCIQFKALLQQNQKKYQLTGQPTIESVDAPLAVQSSSEESIRSLQLKPPPNNPKRWDYVVPGGTPSRSEESSQSRVAGTPMETDSQPVILDLDGLVASPEETPSNDSEMPVTANADDEGCIQNDATEVDGINGNEIDLGVGQHNDGKDDELAEYIKIMQEYKNLPLDDDDAPPTVDLTEEPSDSNDNSGSEGERRLKQKPAKGKIRPSRKRLAFEDRFSCNSAGPQNAKAGNPNARTIEVLQHMASYYDRINDHWRTISYRKAISTLKRQNTKVTTEDEALRLPSIGQRLAQKIEEIVTTDKLQRLEYAQDEPMDDSLQLFLQIYGVGNRQAQQWIAQGFRTLDDLRERAKLTTNQLIGIEHYDDLNTRIPRREVKALGDVVLEAAATIDAEVELIVGGSYRRGAETSGDIDFIITKPSTSSSSQLRPFLDALVQKLETDDFLVARLASSRSATEGSKWHGCCILPRIPGFKDDDSYRRVWRRIDFLLVPAAERGAALIYFTGNDIFNRSLRLLASKKGMRLNQRGLYKDVLRGPERVKLTEGELVEGRDERRIFEILGVKWREPHERWC
ncbi:hypothetical protein G7046_g1951 [Stylonectria norvegica]|nr:hypothetical protein G7046_g1951 [Stylonectria norvegica]